MKTHGAVTKLKCGCQHDDIYWLAQCDADRSATEAIHARWAQDHAQSSVRQSQQAAEVSQPRDLSRALPNALPIFTQGKLL